MSARVDQEAVTEMHPVQIAAIASSSSIASSHNTKVSMFKGKVGFVIPKNKFSGSLVPIFRGGKKSETSDAATEENSKQLQRTTKWGPDLSQDLAVRKGRALAYQTRVDQITQQLKLGSLGGEGQSSEMVSDVQDRQPTRVLDYEKLKNLELERREVIGEILQLNPNYKAPSDYQPLTREGTVPIPVKEHPGFNFVGLLYGPDGDTHKRLEKETGTKMQVYGIKSETREKVEITASDDSEVLSCLDELYVQISADTYDKVDSASALLELLLSSVPGKSAASKALDLEFGDKTPIQSDSQDLATVSAVSAMEVTMGPISTSSQGGPFQQFQGSWFPTSQPNMPSGVGVGHVRNSTTFPFNPAPFAPRPPTQYAFGSSQNIPLGPPRSRPPLQIMQGLSMPHPNHFGQAGPPLMGRPAVTSSGWAPQSMPSGSFVSSLGASQSLAPPQRFSSHGGPTTATTFVPIQSFPLHNNPPMNTLLRPGGPVSSPNVGPSNVAPTFTPLRPMGGPIPTPTPRRLLPNSNDFTFLPQRPQQEPNPHFVASQRPPPQPQQHPSFRQNTMPGQIFPRTQVGSHSGGGQFAPPSPNLQMGPRNVGPALPHQRLNPFTPRMGHSGHYQHPLDQPRGPFVTNQYHPNSSGRPHVYDPFGPTSAHGNSSSTRRQESDPEYEDLMASVGVKYMVPTSNICGPNAKILDEVEAEMVSEKQQKEATPPSLSIENNSEKMYYLAEATHPFTAESAKELSLAVGDYLVVRKVTTSGWSEGECKGKAGWFPSAYVEKRQRLPSRNMEAESY